MTAMQHTAAQAAAQTRTPVTLNTDVTPALAAALEALNAAEAEMNRLNEIHDAAIAAAEALRETSTELPYPDVLTTSYAPTTLIIDGVTKVVEHTPYTYRDAAAIRQSELIPTAQKAPMLEALAARDAAQKMLDDECGVTEADEAEERALAEWQRAYHAFGDALEAALRVPTIEPDDLAAKNDLLAKYSADYEEDAEFRDALLAGTLAAIGAAPPPVSDMRREWRIASAGVEAAAVALEALYERRILTEAAIEAATPPAPDNAWRYHKGEKVHVLGADSLQTMAQLDFLNPALVEEIRTAVLAHTEAKRAVSEALGLPALEEEIDAAEDAEGEADAEWFATPAPDIDALIEKQRRAISLQFGRDAEDPEHVRALLSADNFDQQIAIHIYRDLMRLARRPSASFDVEPFDVEGWVHQFEALPGHVLHRGQVAFQMPMAWTTDPDLQDEAFTLSDPVEIRKYHDATAARGGEYAAYIERCRAERPNYDTHPICFLDDLPDTLFPDDPAKLADWRSRMKRRREACKGEPVGRHLWDNLPRWAKNLVQEFGRRRGEADEDEVRAVGYAAVEKRRHEEAKAAVAGLDGEVAA